MSHAPLPRPQLLQITWPIYSEQLLHLLVGVFGVWLVSRLSDDAAAAYGLSNQIMLTFMITFRFVSVGASVVVTQYIGAGDRDGAEQVARASLGANAWMGIASCVIIALGASSLLSLMNTPASLLPTAKPYLIAVGVMLAFDAVNFSMGAVLRAHTYTRDTLRLIVVMYVIQLALSLPLMFGFAGWGGLGMNGLAVAAVIGRACSFFMHRRLWIERLGIRASFEDYWRIRPGRLREMLHIGLPGAGENVVYRVCFMIILAMIADMGPAALATHTYTMQIVHFLLLFALAIGFGTEIVVGHRVGAGEFHGADRQVRGGLLIGFCVCVTTVVATALVGPRLLGLFTRDPEVIATGSTLLWLNLLVEPGRTLNLVVINGLRATGDARFPVGFGVFSMFAVAVGLSWLLGVHLGWGLAGVWVAYGADEWVRGLAMAARWHYRGWVPHARRTLRRVRLRQPRPA
ncbi:multidrug transporter MatE [Sorangium cellulosum]|uniref:Multidrug transporter MatE n=1 Tax=Sorangium cellulosum TaxID=56 RepID=A0A2L0EMV9_SORCE|nr:MATE family efflux transporter [Sorangium cellulosum]AUX40615.1 multidrug transporter MatE [Sorangium cellulosum]